MLMADVIAMWQMEKPLFCEADVIAQWQMEWPLQGVSSPGWMLFPEGSWQGNLFQLKFRGVMQNLIPYVRQMVFAYVLI